MNTVFAVVKLVVHGTSNTKVMGLIPREHKNLMLLDKCVCQMQICNANVYELCKTIILHTLW